MGQTDTFLREDEVGFSVIQVGRRFPFPVPSIEGTQLRLIEGIGLQMVVVLDKPSLQEVEGFARAPLYFGFAPCPWGLLMVKWEGVFIQEFPFFAPAESPAVLCGYCDGSANALHLALVDLRRRVLLTQRVVAIPPTVLDVWNRYWEYQRRCGGLLEYDTETADLFKRFSTQELWSRATVYNLKGEVCSNN